MHFIIVKLFYMLFTPFARVVLKINGAKIGRSCRFAGIPYVHSAHKGGIKIGANCRFMSKTIGNFIGINHRCLLTANNNYSELTIGDNCGFSGTSIWCFERITIGNNVRVGANVIIMDGDAHQDDPRSGNNAPIEIHDNVWIGANVIILKGVTVGRNTLIGAGSVVVKDIPANTVAAGNPCKPLKTLSKEVSEQLEKQTK